MNRLNRLEQKLNRYAIKGLITYIIGLNGIIFLLYYLDQTRTFIGTLTLDPMMVWQGEWWRMITFAFIPPTFSPLWLLFVLHLYHMIGSVLEHEWGSFRFNLYYFCGIAGTAIGSFLTGTAGTPTYLNLSLFLAFARLFPDYELTIFFILPVKVKYLAWLNWFFFGYTVILQPYLSWKVAAVIALINYFLFFGKEIGRQTQHRKQVNRNRQRFYNQMPSNPTIHRCEVCGKTEKDDSKLEFRYCADCQGDHEYCMEHLQSHQHHQNHSENNTG